MNFSKLFKTVFSLSLIGAVVTASNAETVPPEITIHTAHLELGLVVEKDGHLGQMSFGGAPAQPTPGKKKSAQEQEFLPAFGDGFVLEPAVQATQTDGNTSTDFIYRSHETKPIDDNVTLTKIELKDSYYPLFATIYLKAYAKEDVIEAWTEFHHDEDGLVTLQRFASSAPVIKGRDYWLTQFHGDWAKEAQMTESKLTPGLKIIDSKLGARASQYGFPSFLLAVNGPAQEDSGEVFGGSLKWSGSFQLAFDLSRTNQLRVLAGINPFASQYHLARGAIFTTPGMLWTWSDHGKGQVSRNFHAWARRYGIRDAALPPPILLNNWEATYFDFNEQKLVSLMGAAKDLGCELFLLDDGWFGNKYPRNNDRAGLGDWQANTNKLPHGLGFLCETAQQRGIRFGLWLEPEMVNPKSELFEQHPDWAIQQPHRALDLRRNQLDLDLSNPAVQAYERKILNDTFGSNPGITYVKWDANRFITQPGSPYLKPEFQSHLEIDYVRALYDLMNFMAEKYPHVMALLCSGGGGRADYGALKYFHSFWPSDNTDPLHRVFIQWGYSHFFPPNVLRAHVTRMGHRPLKFALDVALSGALGFDLDLSKTSAAERAQMSATIELDKKELRSVVSQGDLYRLESPYDGPRACQDYVAPDQKKAVLFVYQIKDDDVAPVKFKGLDGKRHYIVREVNLPAGTTSKLDVDGQTLTGENLMTQGVRPACKRQFDSAVIELTAVP